MLGLRVFLTSVALLLVLSGSVLSLSVSASASGAWLRHRLAMRTMAPPPPTPDTCKVPLNVPSTEAPYCFDGCTLTRGQYQPRVCIELFFNPETACRYTWGPLGTPVCINRATATQIYDPNGFCGPLKAMAFQLLTAEINADPAIGNAFASQAVIDLMAEARALFLSQNTLTCENLATGTAVANKLVADQLEAFNKGQADGSSGHCEKVEVTCPTGTLEAESGYNFGPVYGSVSSSLTSTVQWSAAGLPPNFVIDPATGAITATPVRKQGAQRLTEHHRVRAWS